MYFLAHLNVTRRKECKFYHLCNIPIITSFKFKGRYRCREHTVDGIPRLSS